MPNINLGDFVVATENIPLQSVGVVKDITENEITVFFVGVNKIVKTDSEHISYLDVKKTGKPNDIKVCNICHLLKNMNEFAINQTDAKGRKTTRPSCNVCRVDIDGKHLMPSEKKRLNAMAPKGIFTCPIFKKTSIVGVTANLVRDHDHHTGKGRAWICDSCNTGLGRFKDDPKKQDLLFLYPL